jgi:hypothetical protein
MLLFNPNIKTIKHDRVWIVDNVTHQLVVHIESVIKILARQKCVADLLPYLSLKRADALAQWSLLYLVANDKDMEVYLAIFFRIFGQ